MKKVMFVMAVLSFVACASPSPRGEDGWGKGTPKVDTVKVEFTDLDSVQVADSSVMVLDSTVSKIGKE